MEGTEAIISQHTQESSMNVKLITNKHICKGSLQCRLLGGISNRYLSSYLQSQHKLMFKKMLIMLVYVRNGQRY
jgi:hypothetical protein